MAKKRAYQTYYRDKNGTLRVQLVDVETGKPVKNPKEYDVIDSTTQQGDELTGGLADETDAPVTNVKPVTFKNGKTGQFNGGDRGGPTGKGKGRKGSESNDFGFINKPSWAKYASLVPGPIGKVAAVANLGVNANNVTAINEARKHLGLEALSTKDVAKGVITGVDEGSVGDVKVGDKSYGVSLNKPVIDGKTQLTAKEARQRQSLRSVQEEAKNFNPQSKLHTELDPSYSTKTAETSGKKKSGGLASIGKAKGLPSGLSMVDGYRATLASVNFDDFDIDPVTREKAKEFQKAALDQNLDLAVDVKNMTRTQEEQNKIEAAGFSKTKKSEHMAGVALDISPVDVDDQVGWGQKQALADSLGWGQLGSEDPAHMGLTKSNTKPGALDMTKERAIENRNYFGSVPVDNVQREALGLVGNYGTPQARPEVAQMADPNQMSSKERFYKEQYAYAEEAGLTGVMADVAVSQAAIESGYGTGNLASKNNNMHSIKAGQTWAGPTASYQDDEVGPSSFRSYENPVESYKDWGNVMRDRFPGMLTAKNLPEALTALDNGVLGKYATAKDYGAKLTAAYNEATPFGTTAPAAMVDPNASSFENYSKSFYDKLQKDVTANPVSKEASPGTARNDSMSSGRQNSSGFGNANRPASGSDTSFGRNDSPSSGRSSLGGSSFGGGNYSGHPSGGLNSPSEGSSHFGGSGLGNPGKSYSGNGGNNSPTEGGNHFGGSGLGNSNKGKDHNTPGTGGFGNYSGGGEKE